MTSMVAEAGQTDSAATAWTWPRVTVVIPHLNDFDRLAICIDALEAQTYPRDRFDVIVCDNGSDRPFQPLAARYPGVRFISEAEQKGPGPARNRGVMAAETELIAFTDSDCVPAPDWLEAGVTGLRARPDCEILGGAVDVFRLNDPKPTAAELYETVFAFGQRRYVKRKNFAATGNIITTKSAFAAIGPFKGAAYPEDLEWGRRAVGLGYRIELEPAMKVSHPARQNWGALAKKWRRTIRHKRAYERDGRFADLRWALFALALLSPPLIQGGRIFRSDRVTRLSDRLRVLGLLVGLRYYRAWWMARLLFGGEPTR
ncbi:MAG: glycosyltransferase [Minwuiales bacterium]|nr:glycosyltransferase [Minwuiales bacterium]